MNILITRALEQSKETAKIFSQHGLNAFVLPMIEFQETQAFFPRAIYDYCVLSSPTAVRFYAKHAENIKVDKYFAVGIKTAELLSVLLNIPLGDIATPDEYYVDQLANLLNEEGLQGKTVLSPGAETRIKDLDGFVTSNGGIYDNVVLYKTVPVAYKKGFIESFMREYAIDAVTFFSPSAVNAFCAVATLLEDVKAVAVGKSTATALAKYNVQAIMPETQTAESMVELLC